MKRLMPTLLLLAFIAPATAEDPRKDPNKETAFRALSYDKALEAAKKEKKIIFIDFYATWCGPCKTLDARTFSDNKVKGFLKGKTVAIKIDVDKEVEMAKKFAIRAMPTLIFVNPEGKEIGRVLGFRNAETFLKEAEDFAKK